MGPLGRQGPELADIFQRHAGDLSGLTPVQKKAAAAIMRCRTAALGGHRERCDRCGYEGKAYNSCWNRHCPKCQGIRQAEWLQARKADLLPVNYFHIVFTIPNSLHPLFLVRPETAYGILMAAVAQTLKEVALNPKRLGARIGFMEILHTWTQKMLFHPHAHCVVPGGGLSPDGTRWIPSKRRFFIHVKILSKVFRGILLRMLEEAMTEGKLGVDQAVGRILLKKAARKNWSVYCKPPFEGPENVLEYLGRYTHRIAISNSRILAFRDGKVTFSYRDRADGNRTKTITLYAVPFLKQFLLHVLPTGFTRIRYYGFMANGAKKTQLPLCQKLIYAQQSDNEKMQGPTTRESWDELLLQVFGREGRRCPHCKAGLLVRIGRIPPSIEASCFPESPRPP